jgi:hypothetical protein
VIIARVFEEARCGCGFIGVPNSNSGQSKGGWGGVTVLAHSGVCQRGRAWLGQGGVSWIEDVVLIRAVARQEAALDGWGCCMAWDSLPAPVLCSVSKSRGCGLGGGRR